MQPTRIIIKKKKTRHTDEIINMLSMILDPPCLPVQARLDRQDSAFIMVVILALLFVVVVWVLECPICQHSQMRMYMRNIGWEPVREDCVDYRYRSYDTEIVQQTLV
ncbi:hypothetical protein M434DRAFT_296185 [Hypoxylon sp. CO27-5]|nr:hypothetical protein M434DRAFT_296185 [Hypoxylon sp. CO27-5]